MQTRLPKLVRTPERFQTRELSDRDLDIIAAIARYNLLPTSSIIHIVGGNERVTDRRLQGLFHQGLVSRFPLRFVGSSEFCYYLDNRDALELLVLRGRAGTGDLDWDQVRHNRDKPFDGNERRLFVDHELVVSRFHATLELACRRSNGAVELVSWRQGPQLHNRVFVPKLALDGGRYYEEPVTEGLPHRPDAFFTLQFATAASGGPHVSHFFYEADRGTMHVGPMKRKFRAHFHYVVKQGLHQRHYGVHPIRAVLVETINAERLAELSEWAADEIVSGAKPSPLFWFAPSELFTRAKTVEGVRAAPLPKFLRESEFVFKEIWLTPADNTRYSLLHP